MKKLLLFATIFLAIAGNAQKLNDSSFIYTKVQGHLLNRNYDANFCHTSDVKYQSDEINKIYLTNIFKCKEKFIGGFYYMGAYSYVELQSDEKLTFNNDNFSTEEIYQVLQSTDNNILDNIYEHALDLSQKDIPLVLDKKIDVVSKHKMRGIAIYRSSAVDNYGFSDAEFSFINFSKKEIKYITFNYWGENRVEDKVLSRNGKFMISSKGIGPIGPWEDAYLKFDNIWSTDTVYYLLLDSVDLLYMDGTKKHITILAEDYLDSRIFSEIEELSTNLKK